MKQNETSQGALLGGRIAYRQLCHGHRSGFEPVLMAAFVPARAHELVLEVGTGAGAALLCLAARIPDVWGVGVEHNETLARLAGQNFVENGFAQLRGVSGDAACLPFAAQTFHHVMANPPWFDPQSTRSTDEMRALARQATDKTLEAWVGELLRVLRDKGSITLALPAFWYAQAAGLLRRQCGGVTLLPLWPRQGMKAKLVLLQARKASRAPDSVLPGLVLHNEKGITPEAESILRGGLPLLPVV